MDRSLESTGQRKQDAEQSLIHFELQKGEEVDGRIAGGEFWESIPPVGSPSPGACGPVTRQVLRGPGRLVLPFGPSADEDAEVWGAEGPAWAWGGGASPEPEPLSAMLLAARPRAGGCGLPLITFSVSSVASL